MEFYSSLSYESQGKKDVTLPEEFLKFNDFTEVKKKKLAIKQWLDWKHQEDKVCCPFADHGCQRFIVRSLEKGRTKGCRILQMDCMCGGGYRFQYQFYGPGQVRAIELGSHAGGEPVPPPAYEEVRVTLEGKPVVLPAVITNEKQPVVIEESMEEVAVQQGSQHVPVGIEFHEFEQEQSSVASGEADGGMVARSTEPTFEEVRQKVVKAVEEGKEDVKKTARGNKDRSCVEIGGGRCEMSHGCLVRRFLLSVLRSL